MWIARIAVTSVSTLLLTACGHSSPRNVSAGVPRLTFAYDRSVQLGYVDRGVVARRAGVAVHDIAYTSEGERVDGYLVEGSGQRRRPGIVVVHGFGGDRSQLLGDAFVLARHGAVALTITEPSAAHPPPTPRTGSALLAQSRAVEVRDVVAIRRAADVLVSLPTVDRRRLGYLGWSAGAKTGAFVAASDPRFKALALLSAGADKLATFVAAAPASLRPLVRRELGSVDPIRYIAWARPGTLLLEDGSSDTIVPREALLNIIRAAPRGTIVRWYPAGHALDAAAYDEAFSWLWSKLAPRP
jgi:dienelactone hydrolase